MQQFLSLLLRPLRYPRFLWAALVWPLLLLPALVFLAGRLPNLASSAEPEYKNIRLAVHHQEQATELLEQLHLRKDIDWIEALPQDFQRLLRLDSLDMALIFPPGFDEALEAGSPARIDVYLRRGADRDYQRLLRSLKAYDEQLVRMRLEALGGEPSLLQGTDVKTIYIGEDSERIKRALCLLLPLPAWLFAFLACAHSAVYLFVRQPQGDTPPTAWLSVWIWGFLSGLLAWVGLYSAMRLSGGLLLIPASLWAQALTAKTLTLSLLALLALSAAFTAAAIPVCRRIQGEEGAFWFLRLGFVLALLLWVLATALLRPYH
jgi:hypothetical protein